jgi:uncharacterized protein YigE (DUF2233 family)
MLIVMLCVLTPDISRGADGDRLVHLERAVHGKHAYHLVRVDLRTADVSLHLKDSAGQRLSTFKSLDEYLKTKGQQLLFATNAGVFEPSADPTGLHVEQGRQLVPLNTRDGDGNFYLKPNGVFFIRAGAAQVVESSEYVHADDVQVATQSGPLLLRKRAIHPAFRVDSPNRRVRSAVGIVSPSEVVFVLSQDEVTFHELATLFRDSLRCSDALYLDGVISQFYLPDDAELPAGGRFAGMLAVTPKP